MPRASDLNDIAPDDVVTKKVEEEVAKPIEPEEKITRVSKSASGEYRQKVYELIKGATKTPLSALLARPKIFNFDSREENEEIILVLRRHWFTNLRWIGIYGLMLAAPMFFGWVPLLDYFQWNYRLVFVLAWYLISLAMAFEQFLSWYFNVFVITEERVIDIDFYNLLDKKISEAKIGMIQDVTAIVEGVSQTMFNYGTVLIQTASEIPVIKIEKIPNPNLVLKVLQQMRGEEEQEEMEGRIR